MKSNYLQGGLLCLIGMVFLGGCGQMTTVERHPPEPSPDKPFIQTFPQPPESPPDQQNIQTFPQPSSEAQLPLEELSEAPSPEVVVEKPFIHTVRWPGETLSRISWWYTGAGRNWLAIAKANQDLDPLKMKIGDEIIIPGDLLQRQEPMTREYRTPVTLSQELEEIGPVLQAPAPQTVDLFGPIDSVAEDIETNLPLERLE